MLDLNIHLADVMTFVLLVSTLVIIPGAGLLRLLGVRAPTPLVALSLSCSTGLVLCCSIAFLGAQYAWWTAPPLLLGMGVAGWVKGRPISREKLDRRDLLVFATIGLCLIALSPWWIIRGETQDGLIPVYPYVDHFLHTSTIIEILRGFPPEQMPHLAGVPFWQYHLFTDLFASLMVAVGDLPVLPTQGAFIPAMGWFFCLVAIAALTFTITDDARFAALASALFVLPELSDTFTLDWLQRNTPSQLALPVSLSALLLMFGELKRTDDEHIASDPSKPRGFILLGGLVAGIFALKAQQFLMVAPALGALGFVLLKDGRAKTVLLSACTGTLILAAPLFHHMTHPEPRPLVWKPGAFAGWMATDQLGEWAPGFLEQTGAGLGTAVLTIVWFATGAGAVFSLLSLLALAPMAKKVRLGPTLMVCATFAIATFFTCYGPVEDGTRQFEAWNVGFFTRLLVSPLLCVLAMLGLQRVTQPLAHVKPGPVLRRSTSLLPLVVTLIVALGRLSSGPLDRAIGFPLPWLAATQAIADHAPDDAVVADVSHLYTGPYLSTFSARRVVVERAIQFGAHYRQVAERVADLELAWSEPDPRHVRWIFDRYGVTHVIEHQAAPLAVSIEQRKGWVLKFDGSVRVWQRSVGPRQQVPPGLQSRRIEATRRHRAVIRVHQRENLESVLRDAQTDEATLHMWSQRARAPYGPRALEPREAPLSIVPGQPPQAPADP